MSKDPAFLFYSADFLVGVMDLTDEETGQYIKLICLQHQKGRLKKESIYRMFPSLSDAVLEKFDVDENGLYFNKRVEAEIEKRDKYIEAQRSNGAKGGRPPKRTENPNETHGFNLGKAKQNPSENENENINENINDNDYIIEQFNIFWELYPKKVSKERAFRAFAHLKPSAELFEQIINALKMQRCCKQWQDRQYIPYPSTWLNGKRWEDEITQTEQAESTFDTDEFFEAALKRGMRK